MMPSTVKPICLSTMTTFQNSRLPPLGFLSVAQVSASMPNFNLSCSCSSSPDTPWLLLFHFSKSAPSSRAFCSKVPTVIPRGFFRQRAKYSRSLSGGSGVMAVDACLTKMSAACGASDRATDVVSRYHSSLSPPFSSSSSSLLLVAIIPSAQSTTSSFWSPCSRSNQGSVSIPPPNSSSGSRRVCCPPALFSAKPNSSTSSF